MHQNLCNKVDVLKEPKLPTNPETNWQIHTQFNGDGEVGGLGRVDNQWLHQISTSNTVLNCAQEGWLLFEQDRAVR